MLYKMSAFTKSNFRCGKMVAKDGARGSSLGGRRVTDLECRCERQEGTEGRRKETVESERKIR